MKKIYGFFAIVIVVICIIYAWHFYQNPQFLKENFEDGFGEWAPDADVPQDPNNPGHPVDWHIERVSGFAHSGRYSLEFFLDGRQDDGTIWIERRIDAKRNTQMQLKFSFWFYSEQESFNTIADVCAYAGVRNPKIEDDFTVIGPANQIAGWKSYVYMVNVDMGSSEELWVAIGITVRWETLMTYYIDDVEIEIR
ncbi:MAG: hypothetical protein QXZ25_03495 [Candidatus Bathyarchaeia archaeon]